MRQLVLLVCLAAGSSASAQVWVRDYYRDDGTHVEGHYRSEPDGIEENNWSYPGNTNPYEGADRPSYDEPDYGRDDDYDPEPDDSYDDYDYDPEPDDDYDEGPLENADSQPGGYVSSIDTTYSAVSSYGAPGSNQMETGGMKFSFKYLVILILFVVLFRFSIKHLYYKEYF